MVKHKKRIRRRDGVIQTYWIGRKPKKRNFGFLTTKRKERRVSSEQLRKEMSETREARKLYEQDPDVRQMRLDNIRKVNEIRKARREGMDIDNITFSKLSEKKRKTIHDKIKRRTYRAKKQKEQFIEETVPDLKDFSSHPK